MNNLSTYVSNTFGSSSPVVFDKFSKHSNTWASRSSQGLAAKVMVFVCFTIFSASLQADTFPVLNTDDAGPGSLREAITMANATPGLDDITFTGVSGTLTLATALPAISEGVTIDGTTAAGYVAGTPSYTIEGNNITFFNTANTSVTSLIVKGLAFQDSDGTPSTSGVRFVNSFSSSVEACSFHTLRIAVSVTGGEDITVLDNSFVNCGHFNNYSITISDVGGTAPSRVNVSGNTFNGGGNGIQLTNMDGLTIAKDGNPEVLIPDSDGKKTFSNVVLNLNDIDNTTVDGFDLSRADLSTVGGTGLFTVDCDNLTVQNNTIAGRDQAIAINTSNVATIHSNILTNNRSVAINVVQGSDVTVTDNEMMNTGTNNNSYSLRINDVGGTAPNRVNVSGNTFDGGGNGIQLTNMDDLTIAKEGNPEVLIPDSDGKKTFTNVVLNLNNIDNTTIDGLDLSRADLSTVGGTGLFTVECDNLTVQNNTIAGRDQAIAINTSNVATIQSNILTNNRSVAINVVHGSDVTVTDNEMTNTGTNNNSYSLRMNNVGGTVPNRVNVSGNTFDGGGNGIQLTNMEGLTIAKDGNPEVLIPDSDGKKTFTNVVLNLNNIDNTTIDGLDLSRADPSTVGGTGLFTNDCDNLTVQNNTIVGRDQAITINTSNVATIHSNILTNNRNAAISVNAGSDATITDNEMENTGTVGNQYSLRISNVGGMAPNRVNVSGNTFDGGGNGIQLTNMDGLTIAKDGNPEVLLPNNDGKTMLSSNVLRLDNIDNTTIDGFDFSLDDAIPIFNNSRGLEAINCDNITIRNNTISRRDGAISVSNSNISMVLDNILKNNRQFAISVNAGSDATITDNEMENTGTLGNQYSLRINNVGGMAPNRVNVSGNTFDGGGNGIQLTNMDGLTIAKDGNPEVLLPNNDGKTMLSSNVLRLDNIDNTTIDGFDFSLDDAIPIFNNSRGLEAINCDNITIRNNTISRRDGAISVSNSNISMVLDNILKNNRQFAISVNAGSDATITDNEMENTGTLGNQYSLRINNVGGTAPNRVNVSGNTFDGGGNGIQLSNMDALTFALEAPAEIILPSDDGKVSLTGTVLELFNIDNTILDGFNFSRESGFGGAGLRINNCENSVFRTLLIDSRQNGIECFSSANLTFDGVSLSNGNEGLRLSNATDVSIINSRLQENNIGCNVSGTATATVFNSNIFCNNTGIRAVQSVTIDAANNYWGAADGSTTDGGSGDTYSVTSPATISNTTTFLTEPVGSVPLSGQEIFNAITVELTNGQTATSVADSTDYGIVDIGTSKTRQFRIANNALQSLDIVGITSSDPAFAVSNIPIEVGFMDTIAFDIIYTPATEASVISTITITNDDCYSSDFSFNVKGEGNNPCDISITDVSPTDESCEGENDGTITVIAACTSCGGGTADIRYSIDGSDFTNAIGVFENLVDATYTVTVRDVNDDACTAENTTDGVVGQGDPTPAAPLANSVTVCESGIAQSASATAPSGSSIVWYDAATDGNVTTAPTGTSAGIYTAYAESLDDVTGCISTTRTEVTLTIDPAPAAPTSSGNIEECETVPTQTLDANDALTSTTGVTWYNAPSDGDVVPSPIRNTAGSSTFFAEYSDGTCTSLTRTAVTITITTGTITYYLDADGDGFGDPNNTAVACALPSGYATNADDCNDAIAAINTTPTYTHEAVCYETLVDAITASGGTGIVRIEADAMPGEINNIPEAVTVEVLAGVCWTNNVLLTNSGTIELIGTGKFINDTDGIYTGSGNFIGNFQNNGNIRIGN